MTEKGLVHIVDDEDAIRRSLDFLLRSAGYRVERWADGEAFLNGVDAGKDACALLDIRMPGIDGIEVQARMAENRADFPLIMLTGHGDIALAVQVMKIGAADFIRKPVDKDTLLQSVEAAFARIADRLARLDQAEFARVRLRRLTEREIEVLDGLACGFPNKIIAYHLGISIRTVEAYRANIMDKLEAGSFADALRVAFSAGLGHEDEWRMAHDVGVRPRDRAPNRPVD